MCHHKGTQDKADTDSWRIYLFSLLFSLLTRLLIKYQMYLYSPFYKQCQSVSHTAIELPLNQPKPSRKTRKNKNGRNLRRSNSVRGPLLQRRLVKERSRTQAKHSHASRKVPMGVKTQKSNVQPGSELAKYWGVVCRVWLNHTSRCTHGSMQGFFT